MSIQIESRNGVVHIEGEMTIYSAATMLRDALAAVGATTDDVAFDLTQVSELDTAGVQILLAARNLAQQQGRTFGIVAASAATRDVLALCGLKRLLNSNDRQVA
ncbi:MAG TPA: STAS domain-containing protein [Steroidobacteraceae bacterium]|jgi:anti-anti-sigma factor